ncbi:MAG: response regulator transcription factor [Bacteriovoracaceae bacterium]|nr:response regulator transcription factor [Bacteriovoracaceae bacterium]
MSENILLVEDETNLGETLQDYLNSVGFQCQWVTNVGQAKTHFIKDNPQIVLLDINLPDGNGLELAQELRKLNKNFVLLFLSAMNDPETRLEGFELGAEDFISKPFALKELTIRLEKILKSQKLLNENPDVIEFGKLKVWFKRYEIQNGQGQILNLSQKECGILQLLYQRMNDVISRDEIIEKIWGENSFPSNRTVDNYIVKLRKWTESDTHSGLHISSHRGIGYRLEYKGK